MANYFSTIPGASGVPLIYVIHEQADATPTGNNNFFEKCIVCAPMTGPIFKANARRVYQVIGSNVQGKASEQWIDPHKRKQNGKVDMVTLRAHYSSEVNASRRIGEAERIRDSIHYKNEISMSFCVFLVKVQKMFNIFANQNEPYSE